MTALLDRARCVSRVLELTTRKALGLHRADGHHLARMFKRALAGSRLSPDIVAGLYRELIPGPHGRAFLDSGERQVADSTQFAPEQALKIHDCVDKALIN